jgi:hypothetical protein
MNADAAGPKARVECLCCHQMETADLLGTTRRTGARMDEIADDDGKLLATGSRVQI